MEAAVGPPQYDLETRVGGVPPRRSPSADVNNSGLSSPGKRKRSDSDGREPPVEQGAYAPAEKRRTPPPGWPDSSAQGMQRVANHQPSYPPPDADPKDVPPWFGARQQRAESPSSDARLVEALQRENSQNIDVRPIRQGETPVNMEHIGGTPRHQITSTTETTAAGVQVDPKKRKRVSNMRPIFPFAYSSKCHCRFSVTGPRLAARHVESARRNAMKASLNVIMPTISQYPNMIANSL